MSNLYAAYKEGAKTQAEEKKSLIDVESINWRSAIVDQQSKMDSEQLSETVGGITDTLSLASSVHGAVSDTLSDVKDLEKKYGKMDTGGKEGVLNKAGRIFKMAIGSGEYKFGDTKIKSKDFASAATMSKFDKDSMYNEWESSTIKNIMEDYELDESGAKKYLGWDI